MKINKRFVTIFLVIIVLSLIITFPNISRNGVLQGLIISTKVIIPSLFPFLVCIFLLIKNQISVTNNFINKVLHKLLGQNFDMFFVFVLSMLGGYPVGAALINEMYKQKIINSRTADIMLTYCVNAGPAFIVIIVGGAFGSRILGIVLLISHIVSSIISALIFSNQLKKQNVCYKPIKNIKNSFIITLTESVNEACNSIIKICCFVILFSVINSYFDYFLNDMPILKYVSLFTEVTSAVTKCKNIYFVSFLLGFSGISIWCQVLSLCENRKVNIIRFILGRIFHGTISTAITYLIIKIFKIKISTFNNNVSFTKNFIISDVTLFISIFIMVIILLISVFSKNKCGKIINDVL